MRNTNAIEYSPADRELIKYGPLIEAEEVTSKRKAKAGPVLVRWLVWAYVGWSTFVYSGHLMFDAFASERGDTQLAAEYAECRALMEQVTNFYSEWQK